MDLDPLTVAWTMANTERSPLSITDSPSRYVEQSREIATWGLAVGVWGDMLAACGNLRALHKHGGMIYMGFSTQIVAFLERQPFVRKVIHLEPVSDMQWDEWVNMFCVYRAPVQIINEDLKLPKGTVVQTNMIDMNIPPTRWHGARLDKKHVDAAHGRMLDAINPIQYGEEFILVQPYSLVGVRESDHYFHWQRVIDYLMTYTKYRIIVIGQNFTVENDDNYRVINLVDKTASMEELYALARYAKTVVTTSNSLSMWCAMEHIPAVVLGSNAFGPGNPYRYWIEYAGDWLDRPPIRVLDVDAAFAKFVRAFWEITL